MCSSFRSAAALLAAVCWLASPAHATPTLPAAAGSTPTADAPQYTLLTGTILGADGRPQPGVCVFPIANRRLITVTDAHGTFQLQLPAAPTQHLQAEYVGLGSTRFDIDGQHPQPVRVVLGR